MLELQPGMVSKICESFKVLHLMAVGSFHDARTEDQPLMRMSESDTRPKKFVSTHGGTFVRNPTAVRGFDEKPYLREDQFAEGRPRNGTLSLRSRSG
jgi:hypothetical protein